MNWLVAFGCGASTLTTAFACGGGSTAMHPQSVVDDECTNGATATAIVATNVVALTPNPSATRVPFRFVDNDVECRIQKALLTLDDLPPGWSDSGFGSEDGAARVYGDQTGQCGVSLARLDAGLRNDFKLDGPSGSRSSAMASAEILRFQHEAADQFMQALRLNCSKMSSYSALDTFRTYGDDTYAFREEFHSARPDDSSGVEIDIRHGDVVEHLTLGVIGTGAGQPDVAAITGVADAKLSSSQARLQPTPNPRAVAQSTLDPDGTQAILTSALPKLADLPRGFVPHASDRSADTDLVDVCHAGADLPRRQRGSAGSFSGGSFSKPTAAISVLLYDRVAAEKVMRTFSDGALFKDGCGGTVRTVDVIWTFEKLSLPTIGDESVAWRATAAHVVSKGFDADTPTIGDIKLSFIVLRRQHLVGVVAFATDYRPGEQDFLSTISIDQLTSLARTVDRNLAEIVDRVKPE